MTPHSRFISCDWGTSYFRLRLIERPNLEIIAQHSSDHGIQSLALAHSQTEDRRAAMGRILQNGIAALGVSDQPEIPVAISGMASSTLGWQALPYVAVPAPLDGSTLNHIDFSITGRRVRLISGLRAPSDVMRGEETELIGLFTNPQAAPPVDDSLVILPGTHSKHVQIRNDMMVDFITHLTGEIFDLLNEQSTLRAAGETQFDTTAFLEGVEASQTLGLSAALFRTRARPLLGQLPPAHSSAYLSGVLIGAEIGTLSPPPRHIILAAGSSLAEHYRLAIGHLLPRAKLTVIPPAEMATAAIRGHAVMLLHP